MKQAGNGRSSVWVFGLLATIALSGELLARTLDLSPTQSAFFLGPLLIALILVGIIYDWFFLLCVLLAWLPFFRGPLQIQIGIVTFNPYSLGIISFAALALYRTTILGWRYGLTSTDIYILLLCALFFVTTLFSSEMITTGYLAFHALFIPVLSYFVIKASVNSERQYHVLIRSYVVGVVIFSLIVIGRFVVVHERVSVLGVPFIGVATFTISALLLLFYGNWPRSIAAKLAAAVIFTAFFVTFSRVYLLFLIISPLLLWLIRRGRAFALLLGILILSLGATVFVASTAQTFVPTQFSMKGANTASRLTSLSDLRASLYGRALAYRRGLERFLRHPIFGVGIHRGSYMVTQHNFQVEWLEYGGIIGYILYASVLLSHFYNIGRQATRDIWSGLGLLIVIIIIGNSATNGIMHGIMPYMAFVAMGLSESRLKFSGGRTSVALTKGVRVKEPLHKSLPDPPEDR